MGSQEIYAAAKNLRAPFDLVTWVAANGKLPVPNFSAGGIATPADAAMVRQLGAETVFVGSGIFMSDGSTKLEVGTFKEGDHFRHTDALHGEPVPAEMLGQRVHEKHFGKFRNPHNRAEAESRAKAIVRASTFFDDPKIIAECSADCMGAMKGLAVAGIPESEMMQNRGW
jgi:pyridoxal 5'-phosphate synthase pdxS subunit